MATATVPSLTRRLLEWANRRATERTLHDEQLPQVEAALRDPRRLTQLHIAAWLLGAYHAGRGAAAVLQGDSNGFASMRLGAGLQRCALLLRLRQGDQRGDELPAFPPLHAANAIALGLALGDPDGEPLYERYRRLPDAFFPPTAHWPLAVRELLKLHADERPIVTPRLGPWCELLMQWRGDPELLARRLHDLLDLHLAATAPRKPQPNDFEDPAVLLYPVEIMAMRVVRAGLQLPNPKVEHPLMHTNLATMVPPPGWPRDELLVRIQEVLRRK